MKKIILYFCFLLNPYQSFSQFDYTFDLVASLDHTANEKFFMLFDHSNINYRVGGNFNIRAFDNIILKTGLRYVEMGYIFRNSDNISVPSIPDSPNRPVVNPLGFDAAHQFIEVPLIGRFELGKEKLSFFVEFGLSANINLSSKFKGFNYRNGVHLHYDKIVRNNHLVFGLVAALGVNFKMSKNTIFIIQPTLRSSRDIALRFDEEFILRNLGLEIGLRKGFMFKQRSI